jgi:hypothetical protein
VHRIEKAITQVAEHLSHDRLDPVGQDITSDTQTRASQPREDRLQRKVLLVRTRQSRLSQLQPARGLLLRAAHPVQDGHPDRTPALPYPRWQMTARAKVS